MALPSFGTPQIPPFPVGSASLLQGRLLRPPAKPTGGNAAPTGGNAAASPSETSRAGGSKEPSQQSEQVSREFESLLLSFVFKAMRQTLPKSDFLGKTRDRDWYSDLFDMELARNFTQGRGIGLSAHIQQDLQQSPSQGRTLL
jgi:Rod binding domain-containing protein